MMNYIQAWVKELQSSRSPVEAKTQFGWTENMQSFILGDREIFADRVEENPASSFTAQYMPMFKRRGTLEAWAEAMKFYEEGRHGAAPVYGSYFYRLYTNEFRTEHTGVY
jgi:hypothetical protein